MLLAELNVRHTRRYMSTRRVALGDAWLPMGVTAYGSALVAGVVAANVEELDEEQLEMLDRLLRDAVEGLTVPRRALRYRLQTDVEGLAWSRHRLKGDAG